MYTPGHTLGIKSGQLRSMCQDQTLKARVLLHVRCKSLQPNKYMYGLHRGYQKHMCSCIIVNEVVLLVLFRKICNCYTIVCQPVRGENPRALASGLSYVQVDNCTPPTSDPAYKEIFRALNISHPRSLVSAYGICSLESIIASCVPYIMLYIVL